MLFIGRMGIVIYYVFLFTDITHDEVSIVILLF